MRVRVLIIFVCLLIAAGVVARADRYEAPPARRTFAEFPNVVNGWRGYPLPPLTDNILKVLGVDDYLVRAYAGPANIGIGLYIGYWASQRQGDAIHSPQNCLPGSGWEP